MTPIQRSGFLLTVSATLLGLAACRPSADPAGSAASSPAASAPSAPSASAAPSKPVQAASTANANGADAAVQLPEALRGLVPAGWRPFALAQGDLDKDGQPDYALGIEAASPQKEGDGTIEEGNRRLLLAIRQGDGSYQVRGSSDAALLCKGCGGAYGDPFSELTAGAGVLTITHFGGSSMRWGHTAEFRWSRKDQAWQLVRFEETSFNATDPNSATTTVMRPPKDFGKIDLADYDPEQVKGQGER